MSTHWGRVTHVFVSKLSIIGSDNGSSPGRRQAIIWTNTGIRLIGHLGNITEILIEFHAFLFKKMHLKMLSGKWRPFCLGLNVLIRVVSKELWQNKGCEHTHHINQLINAKGCIYLSATKAIYVTESGLLPVQCQANIRGWFIVSKTLIIYISMKLSNLSWKIFTPENTCDNVCCLQNGSHFVSTSMN